MISLPEAEHLLVVLVERVARVEELVLGHRGRIAVISC
jgi:hypothetical protein